MEHFLTCPDVINNDRQAALSSIFTALRESREELESKDILRSYEM